MKKELKPRRVFVNPVFKDKATILKSNDETGGEYSLGELEVSPGGKNFLHIHNSFEETFTSIKGILGIALKDKRIYLKPGESITVPKNTPHNFFNSTNETVICHVRFVPGNGGFEKGLAIGYGLAADGKTNKHGLPKNFTHMALLINLTDTNPDGPLSLLMPVFNWLAKRARKKGIEKKLLEKYYYQ
jgi:mannose-6-phosphate isomerase-like protein (cupin superfamily)